MADKITLQNVASFQNDATAVVAINNNNASITTALNNTLSRDGTSPNQMGSAIDMNSNQIVNLPNPAGATSPLRFQDLTSFIGGGTITNIPVGGNTGDNLVKNSNTNYDVKWQSEAASLVAGTNIAVTGTNPATVATIPNANFATNITSPQFVLGSTALNTTTGTGSTLVLSTSPAIATPTLTAPVISTITNTGTLTLPTITDTLVGRVTTDTLTNKTLTSPVLTTPALGVATATTINSVSIGVGQISGTATNDNATAGNIGEYVESVIASGSAVSLSNGTAADLTTISLTAGDWDVDAVFQFTGGATTTVTFLQGSVSTTVNTIDQTAGRSAAIDATARTIFNDLSTTPATVVVPPLRFSLSGTTTMHAVARASFGTSTCTVYGILRARRVR